MNALRRFLVAFLLVLGLVILPTRSAAAQSHDIRIEHLSPPDARVTSIWEDRQGFMWFGTHDGLYRYDGYTYTAYYNDPIDSTSIADNFIEELLEDSQGNLWVGMLGSLGGLDRYDPATDSFIHYRAEPDNPDALCSDYVQSLYETRDGTLWVGSGNWVDSANGGLSRYDRATDTFRCFRFNPDDGDGLSGQWVYTIYEDRQGALWVGSSQAFLDDIEEEGGLCRFERDSERFTCYRHDPEDENSLINNNVMTVFEDSEGVLWVGTMGDGLHRMDRERGTFTRYPYDPNHPEQLSGPPRVAGKTSSVTFIHEDGNGLLWIGGWGGVHRYDRTSGNQSMLEGLSNAWEIYIDRAGTIWIGHGDAGGLARIVSAPELFQVETQYGGLGVLVQQRDKLLWVGTWWDGVYAIDRDAGTEVHYVPDPDDLLGMQTNSIRDLYEDRAGSIWIVGNLNGIDRFDHTALDQRSNTTGSPAGRFTHYDVPTANALIEDREGRIWAGTSGNGLYQLDREGGHIRQLRHDPDSPNSLGSDYILSFYEDPSGNLWIGTSDGLSRFDPATGRFTNFSPLRMVMVMAIREDPQGRLWVGSNGGGVHLFDRDTGTSTFFTTEHGLAHNNVQDMLIDDHGTLWISTERGLSRFDPVTQFFYNYTTADGLPSVIFMERSGAAGPDGELFFGTARGIVSFSPKQVQATEAVPPALLLTEFQLAGGAVSIGPDAPLKVPITLASEIILTHRQNDFGFTYAGMYSPAQSSVQYAYMLEGYDNAWRRVGVQRQANFTNLDPGAYVFRVKAATQHGWWNENATSIRVTILPPWWKTWWAYALYALVLVGAVVGAFRVQRARLLRQAEVEQARLRAEAAELQARAMEAENERNRIEVEKAHELETAYNTLKTTQAQLIQSEKLASLGQLTSGIAHELKNPLNFVNNFAEVNEELAKDLIEELSRNRDKRIAEVQEVLDDLAHGLKTNTAHIAKHGKRADRIVQNMMDHARGGTGERYDVGVNKLVNEYVGLSFQAMQVQKPDLQVKIERSYDETAGTVEMAPQEMGRALLNVLNNAFEAVSGDAGTPRQVGAGSGRGDTEKGYVPTVTISTRRVDNGVEIRICDNGPGIPQNIRGRIFEPFFTTKPTGSGTGLGLSLAYDIVTQGHGGTLAVESEEGAGATFVITLPTRGASRLTE